MDIYFIFSIIIKYYFIYFIDQIVPSLAIRNSSIGSCPPW